MTALIYRRTIFDSPHFFIAGVLIFYLLATCEIVPPEHFKEFDEALTLP